MTKKVSRLLIAMLILLVTSNTALTAPGDEDEQLRRARQQEQERQQRQQSRDVFLQPKVDISQDFSLPEENPSFLVRKVMISGKDAALFFWLQDEADRYNNRFIGKQGIDLIAKRLGNDLINRGFITSRLLVPEQDISTGTLTLELVAGRIGEIYFAEPVRHADWQGAFPCSPGDVLNLRDLEQGLEQLKRIPSQDVDFKLVPGKLLGFSDVVITMKRSRPDKFILSMDDSGNKSTGRLQSSYTYSVDNLFGKNDLFNVSLSNDAQVNDKEKGTGGNSFYWSVPDGYNTYTLSYRSSNYKQTIPIFGAGIEYTGNSETWEEKIEHLLQRDKTSKTTASLKIQRNSGHNYINDVEILNQRKKTTSLELGLSKRRYIGKDTWDYQLAYRHGMPWLNAQNDDLGGELSSRYGLWTAEIDLNKPINFFGKEARYSMTIRGQYTNSNLYASECFSIGNRYTVRGFDGEQTLMGDNGWYWRNELSFPIADNGREIYYGLDYGNVSGPSTKTLESKNLLGGVIGLRGPLGNANVDIFVGWPLKNPSSMTSKNPTIGFQCSWQLY